MAYDDGFAQRILEAAGDVPEPSTQKMFGGWALMSRGNMVVGIMGNGGLLVRADPDQVQDLLAEPGADVMRMGAREMKGFIVVDEAAVESDEALDQWIRRAKEFVATMPAKVKKKK